METKLFNFEDREIINILLQGDVLAFPTETVFGFGIIYDSKEAFEKLCNLKNRRPDKPFTIMVSNKDDIQKFVDLNEKMVRLINKFMPGELTIIFPSKKGLDEHLTLNQGTVGIRIPDKQEVLNLIKKVKKPLLVTSANLSNMPPLFNQEDVLHQFDGKIRGIVQGGCKSLTPSTIIRIEQDNLILVRRGSVSFEDILKEWNL